MKVKNIMFSGFAAAILMGTVDASAALRIASKDYVDTQVGALSGNGGAITSLQTRMTTAEGTLNTLTGDGAGSVAKAEADAKSYADTKAGAAETAAKSYADGLAVNYATAEQGVKADAALPATTAASTYQTLANKVTDLSGTFENDNQYPSAKAVKAALAETGGDVSGVSSRVTTLENAVNNQTTGLAATHTIATENQSAIATLNGDEQTTGSVDKKIADALEDYTTTTDINTALNAKANSTDVYTTSQTYTKTEVDNLLNAKQVTLTEDQLAAANSGITTAKRTSYDTVVNTMNGTCNSESDYCALVKGPTGAITWVEITNPFTAGSNN